jgi:hypothetical protein
MNLRMSGTLVLAGLIMSGCMSAAQHRQSLGSTNERETTLGTSYSRGSTGTIFLIGPG